MCNVCIIYNTYETHTQSDQTDSSSTVRRRCDDHHEELIENFNTVFSNNNNNNNIKSVFCLLLNSDDHPDLRCSVRGRTRSVFILL